MSNQNDFLRDPIWQFIGTIVSIAGVIISILALPGTSRSIGILVFGFLGIIIILSLVSRRGPIALGTPNSNSNGPALGHLIVVDNGPSSLLVGTRFDLEAQNSIGRDLTNTIQISDSIISSEHTRLWFRKGVWYVQDAGSATGTFVNRQPAREATRANLGDIIRVGKIQFKLTT